MHVRTLCVLSTAASLLFLTGCAGIQSPGVQLTGATLGDVSDEAFVIDFALDLSNPNSEPLELYEFEYSLSVGVGPSQGGGSRDAERRATVYRGRRSAEATLHAQGGKSMTIPVVVRFDEIGASEVPPSLAYALDGTLWYITPGELAEILFDTGVRRPSVSFGGSGDMTFQESE